MEVQRLLAVVLILVVASISEAEQVAPYFSAGSHVDTFKSDGKAIPIFDIMFDIQAKQLTRLKTVSASMKNADSQKLKSDYLNFKKQQLIEIRKRILENEHIKDSREIVSFEQATGLAHWFGIRIFEKNTHRRGIIF